MNRANTIRLGFLLTAVAVACAPQPPQRRVSPVTPTSPIDTTAIRGYTRFLSDDALAGRMTGTPSADLSALYIESACIGIGLSPIGKHYRQPIELERTAFSGSGTKLVLTGARGVRQFDYRSGFLPNMWFDSTAGFSGPAFYLGTSEDIIAGRIRSLDLRGGVAVLAGPLFEPADDTLKARGVVGVIQLTRDESQYLLYVRSRGDSRLRFADRSVATSLGGDEASIVASPALSRDIVAGVSVNSAPERTGDSVVVTVNARRTAVTSSNVGCMLEGTDPKLKDTAIAFTAHYDHLGVGLPDARGDSIYNGFSDNAAGVGMLLAIGSAFGGRPGPRPRHSILLLFFTGEEAGLLGSDYYVAHPEWPLQKTRAVVNLDAGAPPAPPWSWRIAGANTALSQWQRRRAE